MPHVNFLYTTAPDAKTANAIASALIEERLAACVNILPGMTSVYRWKDTVESAAEVAMIVKTTDDASEKARDAIMKLHPFETPCIVSFPVDGSGASEDFLNWVIGQTTA